jgi:hypothetical protein
LPRRAQRGVSSDAVLQHRPLAAQGNAAEDGSLHAHSSHSVAVPCALRTPRNAGALVHSRHCATALARACAPSSSSATFARAPSSSALSDDGAAAAACAGECMVLRTLVAPSLSICEAIGQAQYAQAGGYGATGGHWLGSRESHDARFVWPLRHVGMPHGTGGKHCGDPARTCSR